MVRALFVLILLAVTPAKAAERFVVVASTTSTANSGLFDHLLPIFQEETGIEVRVVAVGTGKAIRLAGSCDADVLLVHHRPSEEKFVAEGKGVERFDVMYNDFVVVGPKSDPAAVSGQADVVAALSAIAEQSATFISRGDGSGTHMKELSFWRAANQDVAAASGTWYRATGAGMGATLNTATAMGAYTLSDRGTWTAFKNKADMAILFEGDARLFNPYGVVLVSAQACPNTKVEEGQAFVDWLIGQTGQKAIADYRLEGLPLFFPNAGN